MKVLVKEYMLDMLDSIKAALLELPRLDDKSNEHLGLLGTCQDVLINIAENLPEDDPTTDKVLAEIDSSCKAMFQLSEMEFLSEAWNNQLESLKEAVSLVASGIKEYEIEKIKAVFMPVLVENWGSMESIYKACLEDSRVDCKVMPIPYSTYGYGGTIQDNNWDYESFKELLAQENLVDCNDYDLATEHPELVFINDPYDGDGDAIRVQPKYFSDELASKTEHIVYVSPECIAMDEKRISTLAGIKNAWKIVAHSLEDKEKMVRGNIGKEKFVGSLSARNDAEFEAKDEQVNVIVELKKLAEDDMELAVDMMEEILSSQNVIKSFAQDSSKGEGKDVKFHWFKDKSFDTEIKRCDEKLVERYEKLIEKLAGMENNSLESPKEYQSLALSSDMYIGQGDGWVSDLLSWKGKPVLKREAGECAKESVDFSSKALAGFSRNVARKGKNVYCFSEKFNGLLNLNLEDGVVSVVKGDEGFSKSDVNLYGDVCAYGNKLIFAPENSGKVLERDLINEKSKFYGEKGAFGDGSYDALAIENFNILMPQNRKDSIYYINRKNGQINAFENRYHEALRGVEYAGDHKIFVAKDRAEGILYRSIITDGLLQAYNGNNGDSMYGSTGENVGQIWDVKYDGKFLWCISYDGTKVSLWNRGKNVISRTIEIMDESCGVKKPCYNMYIEDNHRWFLSGDGKTVVRMDKKGQKRVTLDVENSLHFNGAPLGIPCKDSLYFVVDDSTLVKIHYVNKSGQESLVKEVISATWDQDSLDMFMASDRVFNMSMLGIREFVEYGVMVKDSDCAGKAAESEDIDGKDIDGKAIGGKDVDGKTREAENNGVKIWKELSDELFSNK